MTKSYRIMVDEFLVDDSEDAEELYAYVDNKIMHHVFTDEEDFIEKLIAAIDALE